MRTSQPVVRIVLLVSLFLIAVPASFAAPSASTTHQTVTETVTWSMSPAQCSSLSVPISGTGQRHQEIITQVNADGTQRIIINDVVKGTATDSTGSYHFVYTNHSIQDVPASGSPVNIQMVDSFLLNGTGSAKHMNVGFNWRWTFVPPALFPPVDNWQQISTRGDPLHCDPI
jgi:pectate lyase